ncbi:hypothetical protein L6R52_42060 [Myxococcota bacterium]|nr:hypothetical protein [Myxococcota bacterium]
MPTRIRRGCARARGLAVALMIIWSCASEPAPRIEDATIDAGVTSDAEPNARDAGASEDAAVRDAAETGADEDAGARDASDDDDDATPTDAEHVDDAGEALDAAEGIDGAERIDASEPLDAGEALDAAALDAAALDAAALDAAAPDASLRPFAVEGFGAATVGGWQPGHDTFVVTSLADDGPGSLREGLATASGPRVVTFAVDGTIALATSLLVPSNLSIDARGRDVVLAGKGLVLAGSDEVIVTNLVLRDVGPDSEDGVRIGDPVLGASERVVLDHLTFEATGDQGDSTNVDEAISVIFGSRELTFAWLRFERWEKVMLFGNGDAPASTDASLRVTIHHTLARGTGRRHPQARHGIFDIYSSFLDDWHMYGLFALPPFRESFGIQAQDGALVVVESTGFRRNTGIWDLGSQANDATRCESGGIVEERATQIVAGGTATLRFGVGCPAVTQPWSRPYSATVDPFDAALLQRLETEAGASL